MATKCLQLRTPSVPRKPEGELRTSPLSILSFPGTAQDSAMPNYPQNLEAALGSPLTFRPSTLRAAKSFASSKPWRGSLNERQQKFQQLHAALRQIYNVNPTLIFLGDGTGDSGLSNFQARTNVITVCGRLSVITFLHEWGHVLKGRILGPLEDAAVLEDATVEVLGGFLVSGLAFFKGAPAVVVDFGPDVLPAWR